MKIPAALNVLFVYHCFVLSLVALFASCRNDQHLFNMIPADRSGIQFSNAITENDSINPIDMDFLYNGGGVAAGDFNNDGLTDLYFTASTVSNKLYLNKGGLSFTDITQTAGTNGAGRWCNAASVVDINNDGLQDIYVCASMKSSGAARTNLMYVNQGTDKNGIPIFKEMAAAYGLADSSYSVHAAFFDYDNDGDLDMYLVTTQLAKRESTAFSSNKTAITYADIDKLFRNDWNDSLRHPFFTDVSAAAGIREHGFGLGVAIADIDQDGWKDIYVSNDFYGSDLLYINNRNGTFTNRAKEYFKHTSQNAMGNDVADINNDGLADIITVDMNPEGNFRKKKNMNGNNYFIYQSMIFGNMMLQYVRNTVQLNSGPVTGHLDSFQHPVFSDIGFYTGMAETDWSWSPLAADLNNDGNRDILVTNGYPRDITDHDFISFRDRNINLASKQMLIDQIPQIKIPNYVFKNKGNLQFENATREWGMETASFSNGAVCIDLDNDGDLDYVVNNINDKAFVYENTTRTKNSKASNYLALEFKGPDKNRFGIGAMVTVFYNHGKKQVYENSPYRGYLSTSDTRAFFGLGNIETVDSLVIIWPGGKTETQTNLAVNQRLLLYYQKAGLPGIAGGAQQASSPLLTNVSATAGIDYRHKEMDFIDFDRERLIPHKLSQYGPGLATADVDGNGLDDILIGGSGDYPGRCLLQQPGGRFIETAFPQATGSDARKPENMGLLLFDADGDGDPDLYCASGSNQFAANTKNYQDQFFLNDGKGHFIFDSTAGFPINYTSKSCVKAADFDNDGDLDLFIGGRCLPGKYPTPVGSFIYRNDSKNGKVVFTDVTAKLAPALLNAGMICDAIWTDFDNDGFIDLITAGEWTPISFYKNNQGKLDNVTAQTGIGIETGWWNSLAAGDFDNDGDIDYVAGNLGQNSFFRASDQYAVHMYAKDFDSNGSVDAITTVFLKDEAGKRKEYTALNRDEIVNQLPGLRKKFSTYKDFGNATVQELFSPEQLSGALTLPANQFASCFIKNLGNGRFEMHALPPMAQLSPLFGLVAGDFNNDGNLDILATGNDYGNEVADGRYDALNGLLMTGNGKGDFTALTTATAGFFVPGDGKALIALGGTKGKCLIAASENSGPLRLFRTNAGDCRLVATRKNEISAFITLKNGNRRKQEIYHGSSFLSQSSDAIMINESVKKMVITDYKGQQRTIGF